MPDRPRIPNLDIVKKTGIEWYFQDGRYTLARQLVQKHDKQFVKTYFIDHWSMNPIDAHSLIDWAIDDNKEREIKREQDKQKAKNKRHYWNRKMRELAKQNVKEVEENAQ